MVQFDDSNEDVPIQDSLKNLVVTRHYSSSIEAKLSVSKQQKTSSTFVVLIATSSPIFELPPKLEGRMSTLTLLLINHTFLDQILNDSFVSIIKKKIKNSTLGALYYDIVTFFYQR